MLIIVNLIRMEASFSKILWIIKIINNRLELLALTQIMFNLIIPLILRMFYQMAAVCLKQQLMLNKFFKSNNKFAKNNPFADQNII